MIERVKLIDLSPLAANAPASATTAAVQGALMNPEIKATFEALIVEIRKQCVMRSDPSSGGSTGTTGAFYYRADTKVTAQNDPGTGKIRWNTADQKAATALYFDWLTDDGFDPVLYFKMMEAPQKFAIQDRDMHVNYQLWTLSAPVIEYPDWFEVPVVLDSFGGNGTMGNNAQIAVLV